MPTSIPIVCDKCSHEHILSEHVKMQPEYCVCVTNQTLSYLKVYCPGCMRWGRAYGRLARATALELKLKHTPFTEIGEEQLKQHMQERNSWIARHSYTLEMLYDEMLMAITGPTEKKALETFIEELDALTGDRLALDAYLDFDEHSESVKQQDDSK